MVEMYRKQRAKADPNTMFLAGYSDGRTAYFTMTPSALRGGDQAARPYALQRQAAGELPAGEITTVRRVR
jgi:hypothetical protein